MNIPRFSAGIAQRGIRNGYVPLLVLVAALLTCPSAQAAPGTTITFTASPSGQTLGGLGSTTLSWSSDATNPNSVSLFRSCDGAATWQSIATGLARTGSHAWTIPLARSATCRVRADVSGGGPTVTSGVFTIDSTPPGPVTDLTATPSSGQVALAWSNPADGDFAGVRIYRTTNTGAATDLGTLVATLAAPVSAWTDSGLTNGTDYGYHVASYDSAGNAQNFASETLDGRQASGRSNGAIVTDGTMIWSFGGMVCSPGCPGTLFNEIWQYDTRYDTFIKKGAVLPTGRFGVRAVWDPISSKIFLLGGRDSTGRLTAIQRYDPVADTAPTTVANLPVALTEGQAVYAPNTGRIYYIGGQGSAATHEIYEFDPSTNAVTQLAARLPSPRERAGAAYHAADGCIYVAGGKGGPLELDTIDRFCPATGVVTRLAARMTRGLHDVALVDDGARLLLLGGRHDPTSAYYATVDELTPASDRIVQSGQRLMTARSLYTAVNVGRTMYAMTPYDPIASPVVYRAPTGPVRAIPFTGTTLSITSPGAGGLVRGGGSMGISWTSDSTNTSSVVLAWSCDDGPWATIATGLAATGTYTWNPVAKVTSNACRVRATLSALSAASDPFTIDWTPPDQTAFPMAYPGNTSNFITWENPTNPDFAGVRIYRSTTEGTLGSLVATVTSSATPNDEYTDSGLTNGTRYIYTLAPYDAAGNARAWTALASASVSPSRFGAGIAGSGTEAFMIGGCADCTRLVEVWRYEPRLDRYAISSSLLTSRDRSSSVYVGGGVNRTFVFGGQTDSAVIADIVAFDPVAGTIANAGSLPGPRTQGTAVYAPNTGKIYYFGGKSTSADSSATATIHVYDPGAGTSSDTGHSLPTARFWAGSSFWPSDGCIYLFGGRDATGADLSQVLRYCPQTGLMQTLSTALPSARREVIAFTGQSEITIVGGSQGASQLSLVVGFDPDSGTMITHGTTLGTAAAFSGATIVDGTATLLAPYPSSAVATRLAPGSLVAATPTATPPNRSPQQTKLVSPADGAEILGLTPTFTATFRDPDGGTGTLHFEVCTVQTAAKESCTQAGGTVVASGTATGIADDANGSWVPSTSLAEGTYYWHAKGEDTSGAYGPWRPTRSVTVTLTSITLSAADVALGFALPAENTVGTFTATVTANSSGGYELFAADQSDTVAANCSCGASIADWPGTVAAPTSWSSGTSGYMGVTVLDATDGRLAKWGVGTNTSESDYANNLYAGLKTASGLLHKRTGPSAGDVVTISFRMNPFATQSPGDYSSTVALTAITVP